MKTQCPNCKSKFNVNEANVGKQAKCPKCAKPFIIEPFIETPPPAATVSKTPEPVVPPVKKPVQAEPPVSPPQAAKSPESAPAPVEITEPEKNKPKRKVLSKVLFVYGWAALRMIAGILGVLGLMLILKKNTSSTLIMTFAAADVFLLSSVLIELILFYKMWAVIQDGRASITPNKAVLFLLVPVFNIYWALLMFMGFADDYNTFIKRESVNAKELSFTLFLIYAFLFIVFEMAVTVLMISIFLFMGLIGRVFASSYADLAWTMFSIMAAAGILHFVIHILVAVKTCNAVNALQK